MFSLSREMALPSAESIERALIYVYAGNPRRWQQFMDDAAELLRATSSEPSGFADTTQHGEP